MVGTIIVGGGKSNRFGEDKISYLIDGKPLIYYTALPFIKSNFINEIVIVLSKDNYKKIKKYFENLKKIEMLSLVVKKEKILLLMVWNVF